MELAGKRVVVMGLGRFGGGVGVSRFLVGRGAQVLVTDVSPENELNASIAQLADLAIAYRLGEHRVEDFTAADLVVVNPAVDGRQNRFLHAAMAAGVKITSEIRLLVAHLPERGRTIGVTGTAGKSTVTAMIGHILGRHGRVHVGGNLGGSLLGELDTISPEDWVVLELSSFMLEGLALDRWSPHIAVVTNIMPNHLDRHGTVEQYARAKQAILEYQGGRDVAILGPVDPHLIRPRTARAIWYDGLATYHPRPAIELAIPGKHNEINATLAIEAVAAAGVDRFAAAQALKDFAGLTHRLQFIAQRAQVRYFNDSKATTPEAAMLAIESFAPGTVHAILGGYNKGSDLRELARTAVNHCRAIYTIGATGDRIAELAQAAAAPGGACRIIRCQTLDRALLESGQRIHSGDVVLLSPACASWDQFENFEARGRAFAEAVLRYTDEGGCRM